ncbi:MAG TPA: arginyltransferase, partial [Hyphomonadaceae bacterium]|nr:arginyltransferase [Hyphomonadaceae bacterium]
MKISESPALKGLGQRRVRFYITNPAPCPYLDGQTERKVFTNLAVEDAQSLHDALSHGGFRRSQSIAYRPACASCKACMAARVPVSDFKFTKRWRRVLNKNKELVRTAVRPSATREQYR